MRDEKEERKKEASKVKQTNKAKQHSTPKAVTFPKKNELPRVGLKHVHVPVLKAGHPGVTSYICLFVRDMVGWVILLFFSFLFL